MGEPQATRARERKLTTVRPSVFGVLAILLLLTTFGLAAFSVKRVKLVDVLVQAQQLNDLHLGATSSHQQSAADGFVVFSLNGTIARQVSGLRLKIRSAHEHEWHDQPPCTVSNGSFFGTGRLGSEQYPLRGDEQFEFQLIAEPGGYILGAGQIEVRVASLVAVDGWVRNVLTGGGVLTFLAEFSQVVTTIRGSQRR